MAGHIICVTGGKGGVGKSMFSANLAFAFAQESRQRVLLLDFDQKACGDLNLITGLKPKKNLKDVSEFSGVIDPKTIVQFVTPHQQNVHYIGMPTDSITADAVNSEGLGKLLKSATNIYPLTIIDVGTEFSDVALKGLGFATMIMILTTPDILAVNQTRRVYNDLVTMLFPKEMLQIVFNGAQKGHPVTSEIVSKQIGKNIFCSIPKDDQTCIMGLNRSQVPVLFAKSSAYGQGVIACVQAILQKNILRSLEKIAKPQEVGINKNVVSVEKGKGRTPWIDLKSRIHKALIEEMDLKDAGDDKDSKALIVLKEKTKKKVVELLGREATSGVINSREDQVRIVKEILDEALGLGPLEDLLSDKSVSEIMVCGPHRIYYEKGGKLQKSDIIFTDDKKVLQVIERIVAPIGRRIDEKTPYVDARLRDGSRVHAIIPPSSIDGCTITIRKFPENRLTYKDLVKYGSLTEPMADFLRIAVEAKRNIIISGGTGSGKTTLINILAGFIPSNERIITCEDSAELDLPQDHVVRLETRPPSLEGEGEIDIRLLVKQTLRMRPDRIIVGECRGGETLDMLQAMGTGHDGSMTTIHSNNPRECIGRVETLVQYAGTGLGPKAIREMIASAVHLIVQQSRLDDGSRKVTFVTELNGMQGDVVTLQDIFLYRQEGLDKRGKIIGKFQASGFIPKFIETLEKRGYNVPRGLFVTADNSSSSQPVSTPSSRPPQQKQNQQQNPNIRPNQTIKKG